MRLLLLSNGSAPGGDGYLRHALPTLAGVLKGIQRVAFVPYAMHDLNQHTAVVAAAMRPLHVEVVGVHESASPASVLDSSQAVFVGGGNAFRLLAALYRLDLLDCIRSAVDGGMPYIGSSAGTNVACPSLCTTNDMPIVEPPTFTALGLVPFQINPHYPAVEVMGGHLGETRDRRISEFLEDNDTPVLGLQEGSWIDIEGSFAVLGGVGGARLFRRGAVPTEFLPEADLSPLMNPSRTWGPSRTLPPATDGG